MSGKRRDSPRSVNGRATDVHPKIKRPAVVKYMFGGPDFVHAATVFPGSPEYILVGMEPLGTPARFLHDGAS